MVSPLMTSTLAGVSSGVSPRRLPVYACRDSASPGCADSLTTTAGSEVSPVAAALCATFLATLPVASLGAISATISATMSANA